MNFKKKVNGSWTDIPHYIHKTSTDIITTLPAVIFPNATTATVGLKGNMQQTGTPTPQNPVMPQGCGERTGNLFDNNTVISGYQSVTGEIVDTSSTSWFTSDYIPISPNQTYTFNPNSNAGSVAYHCAFDHEKNFLQAFESGLSTMQMPTNATFLRITYRRSDSYNIMLNTGSTALPYEPYGYKIPISSANTTTNIYLGEVETTRKIKKLVLTGEESVSVTSAGMAIIVLSTPPVVGEECVCSHYIGTNVMAYSAIGADECTTSIVASSGGNRLAINDVSLSTTDAYKAFFAQQYSAGTPVTVWYVLSSATTGIVNEPIRKIGDYADEVSNISIPVTAGGDTISVDTTLQPSEMSATYKGWHPAIVHERENGAWT